MRPANRVRSPWLRGFALIALALLVGAPSRSCSRPDSKPVGSNPAPTSPAAPVPQAPLAIDPREAVALDGTERLEWEQEAPSLAEVQTYRYMALSGLARHDLPHVQCAARPGTQTTFVCTSGLPPLPPGFHRLRILAVSKKNGRDIAGGWSRPLLLRVGQ